MIIFFIHHLKSNNLPNQSHRRHEPLEYVDHQFGEKDHAFRSFSGFRMQFSRGAHSLSIPSPSFEQHLKILPHYDASIPFVPEKMTHDHLNSIANMLQKTNLIDS